MSSGIRSATNSAISALQVTQEQLSVVSTNLANANNADYHLRTTNIGSYDDSGDSTSSGVYVTSVTRAYNLSLETSLHTAIANNSYQQSYYTQLSEVQNILGSDNTSYLNNAVVSFSDALASLEANPKSTSYRSAVISAGDELCSVINSEYSELTDQAEAIFKVDSSTSAISGSLSTQVDDVNDLLKQINSLNNSIASVENGDDSSQQALDLRDQRDSLVKELAAYGDFSFTEEDNGQYSISISNGSSSETLIDGSGDTSVLQNTLVVAADGSGNPEITLSSGTVLTLTSESGSLAADVDSYTYIKDTMTDLYNYASAFATAINDLQGSTTAYDLDGNSTSGSSFFDVASSSSRKIITLDSYVDGNPRKLAVSQSATDSGDGSNAEAMWEALNNTVSATYNTTLLKYADQILTNVSQDVSTAESNAENTASIQSMFEDEVSSFSGVSTDTELVSMLNYQRAYQAAAKVVTAIDEMLQTVINM